MLLLLLSIAFFVLAFVIGLPTIVFRPHKFALTFTLGSLCFMGSFAMLKVSYETFLARSSYALCNRPPR